MTTPALSNHLADGYADGRPGETASLQEAGREWTDAADIGYRPTSVLGQYQLSAGNGRSEEAARRVLGYSSAGPVDVTQFPSGNGTSEGTSQEQTSLRIAGNLPI